jgi:hypothetical protein
MISLGSTWDQVEINFPVGKAKTKLSTNYAKLMCSQRSSISEPSQLSETNFSTTKTQVPYLRGILGLPGRGM